MKLRKLILNAKLREIKKQNILVFHCNLTATEWRQLKNLLCRQKNAENQKSIFTKKKRSDKNSTSKSLEKIEKLINGRVLFLSKSSSRSIQDSSSSKTDQIQMKLAGCLFFFNQESKDLCEDRKQASKLKPFELLKKVESSEFNNHLLLLYGQMNHTPFNHIDLKIAARLDPQETHQQLLFSIQQLSMSLNSFLYQNINDFIQMQEQNCSRKNTTKD